MALGAHPDEQVAWETLEFALARARGHDLMFFLVGVTKNVATRRVAIRFFKENYSKV
jgi:hypothetical protein